MNTTELNKLLQNYLNSSETPDRELNQKIKILMLERVQMNKKRRSSIKFALVAVLILVASSIAVYAAVKYFSPGDVAHKLGYPKLAEAFESEDALLINKTVSSGGYNVTLLGILFGRDLQDFDSAADKDKTYAVVAIEKQGGKMPDTSDDEYGVVDFFISPLIKGFSPWQLNIFTMDGGSVTQVFDGVMYRLIECDSVEMFADKGVYIGISNNRNTFCDNESFIYNFDTGEILPNTENGYTSVVFELPIDISKADSKKAEEFLRNQNLINDEEQQNDDNNSESNDDDAAQTDDAGL